MRRQKSPIRKINELKSNMGSPYHFTVGSLINTDRPELGKVCEIIEDGELFDKTGVVAQIVYIEIEKEHGKEIRPWKKILPNRVIEYQVL